MSSYAETFEIRRKAYHLAKDAYLRNPNRTSEDRLEVDKAFRDWLAVASSIRDGRDVARLALRPAK